MKRLLLLALVASACGTEEPDPPDTGKSLFPVAVGNRWEYRIQDSSGSLSEKIQTVTGTAAAGYRFHTDRGDRETLSVQRIDDQMRLVRVEEQGLRLGVVIEEIRFEPPAIRLDLDDIELGTEYTQTFTERHLDGGADVTKTQTWTIEAVDDPVTVPGGTFRAVRVHRVTEGGPEKTYWYAPGVGKVKEVGGQLEELTGWEVAE